MASDATSGASGSEAESTGADDASAPGRRPPGPRGLPLVGNLHRFVPDPLAFIDDCAETYGDVVRTNVGWMDSYMVTHPTYVERVLVTEDHRFRKADAGQGLLEPIFGDGLVVSDGERWRRQRTRMQPAFRPDRIANYAEIMAERATSVAEGWSAGRRVTVDEEMRRLTLSILVRSLFGTDLEGREAAIREAFTMAMDKFEGIDVWLPGWLPTPANRRFERGRERLDDLVYELIDERRADPDLADREDLLSILLLAEDERGERMGDDAVRDEVVTLMAAGHDTTSLALTYAWHLLGTHPEVEDRLHEEIESVLGGEPPTFEDVPALEYADAVVHEAMRLYPPVHATAREPTEDVRFGEYVVPEGSILFTPQWVLHRDERYWEDPDEFRPERWLEDRERPEYAYFPFGGGPRHCLGHRFATTEAIVLLATIASRWSLEPLSTDLEVRPAITVRPTDPVEMVVRER